MTRVCRASVKKQLEPLYDEICAKLTDFENDNDIETTSEDWVLEFYQLLVRAQNEIELIEE